MLGIEKNSVIFSGSEQIPKRNTKKICKSLPEYLICQGASSLISHVNIPPRKEQNVNRAPNFVSVPRLCTIQDTSTPQNSSKWLLSNVCYFLERRKQFFIPPLCLIRMKSCNCIKIKSISFIMLKKTALIYPSNFLIQNTKNHFMVAFYFMFTFSFKSLHLILKKLIKHENKFDRKAFHDRANSENLFSQFSYFMKGFKKYIMNIYR